MTRGSKFNRSDSPTGTLLANKTRWLQLALLLILLIGLSVGLSWVTQRYIGPRLQDMASYAWVAYLSIFTIMLLGNATLVAPVPVTSAIMIALATQFNPFLIGFFAALGGSIGELSGYWAGYLGKKIAISEDNPLYDRIQRWMNKYGLIAITFLAFQPVLPFDIGGLIAGAARMPLWKFFPALFLGKLPKYVLLAYFGTSVTHYFHFFGA